jgi:Family of unknown function (DUF6464)
MFKIPVLMDKSSQVLDIPTEVILTASKESLGMIYLDWMPQPGSYVDVEGQTYAVLERCHRYQLRSGRYQLQRIAIYVQVAERPSERSLIDGRWVVGDASCGFNARSELVRCAVQPTGPCKDCRFYEAV